MSGSPGRDQMLLSNPTCKAVNLLTDPAVIEAAEKCGKTPAQVLLRHAIQKNIAVIPKSSDETRLRENFEIFNFYLIPAEMRQLDTLNKGQFGRSFDYSFFGESFLNHPDFPFLMEIDDTHPPAH
jgi:alcohol dehydrogenase (NADP+)